MIYRTSRCPKCGKVVEQSQGYATDLYLYIGTPFERCLHCGVQYLTGRKYWPDMTSWERRKIYGLLSLALLFGGLKVAAVVMLVIGGTCALLVNYGGFEWPEAQLKANNSLIVAIAIVVLAGSYFVSIRSHLMAFASLKKLGSSKENPP